MNHGCALRDHGDPFFRPFINRRVDRSNRKPGWVQRVPSHHCSPDPMSEHPQPRITFQEVVERMTLIPIPSWQLVKPRSRSPEAGRAEEQDGHPALPGRSDNPCPRPIFVIGGGDFRRRQLRPSNHSHFQSTAAWVDLVNGPSGDVRKRRRQPGFMQRPGSAVQ